MSLETFNGLYKEYEPMLQEARAAFLPEKADSSWLRDFAGDALFEWDERGVTSAWLLPVNSVLRTRKVTGSAFLAALVLEGLGESPGYFKPILVASQISPVFSELMRNLLYEGYESLEQYTACGEIDPAVIVNVACGFYSFEYFVLRREGYGLKPEQRLYLSEVLARDCNAFGVGSSSLIGWWRGEMPISDEEEYFQALIDTEINFRFRRPLRSAAVAGGASQVEVEALAGYADFLGLAGFLGQTADWRSPSMSGAQDRQEGQALISSLFGLEEVPYRHLGGRLYGKKDTEAVRLLREKAGEFANAALAALEESGLEGSSREIFKALAEYAPSWSATA